MPNFPIIDTHLHVWDQTRLKYSAFDGSPLFGHPYHVEDYRRDCGNLQVEAMVFLECYADFWKGGGQYVEEVEFVEEEQKRDPRIKAIIAMAPVEWGAKVEPILLVCMGVLVLILALGVFLPMWDMAGAARGGGGGAR